MTVSTKGWVPVIIWIFRAGDPRWHMRFETELAKLTSDWRDLSAFLARAELSEIVT